MYSRIKRKRIKNVFTLKRWICEDLDCESGPSDLSNCTYVWMLMLQKKKKLYSWKSHGMQKNRSNT